jgi:hypothetical protein
MKTLKTLMKDGRDSIPLVMTTPERLLLAACINQFGGDGGRPYAEADAVEYFTAAFVLACAGVAYPNLRPDKQAELAILCTKIRDAI